MNIYLYIFKNYYNAHAREDLSTGGDDNEQV